MQKSEQSSNETKKQRLDSLSFNEKRLSNNSFVKTDSIVNQQYKLSIESSFVKEVIDTPSVLFNVCVLSQVMIFSSKDSIFSKVKYPVRFFSIKTKSKKDIIIQENNIYEVSIVKGDKGWFYKISGGSILNTQSEFYGVYSPTGKLLWYSYTSYQNLKKTPSDLPDEGYGDIDKVFEEYGVAETVFNKPSNSIEIDFSYINQ